MLRTKRRSSIYKLKTKFKEVKEKKRKRNELTGSFLKCYSHENKQIWLAKLSFYSTSKIYTSVKSVTTSYVKVLITIQRDPRTVEAKEEDIN